MKKKEGEREGGEGEHSHEDNLKEEKKKKEEEEEEKKEEKEEREGVTRRRRGRPGGRSLLWAGALPPPKEMSYLRNISKRNVLF